MKKEAMQQQDRVTRRVRRTSRVRHTWMRQVLLLLSVIGPGLITANVDNDATCITGYSLAGAQYGYGLLWAVVLVTISLAVVQEMVARMGVVTGKGLSDLIRENFPLRLTVFIMFIFLLANGGVIVSEFIGIAAALHRAHQKSLAGGHAEEFAQLRRQAFQLHAAAPAARPHFKRKIVHVHGRHGRDVDLRHGDHVHHRLPVAELDFHAERLAFAADAKLDRAARRNFADQAAHLLGAIDSLPIERTDDVMLLQLCFAGRRILIDRRDFHAALIRQLEWRDAVLGDIGDVDTEKRPASHPHAVPAAHMHAGANPWRTWRARRPLRLRRLGSLRCAGRCRWCWRGWRGRRRRRGLCSQGPHHQQRDTGKDAVTDE